MTEDNINWRTPNFRQNVVQKINEVILSTGTSSSRNGIEMEAHAFIKAKNKDEYLAFVARFILHVREMNLKNKIPKTIGDVNNTVQNIASPGTRNPQMIEMSETDSTGNANMGVGGNIPATNLLETLTQISHPIIPTQDPSDPEIIPTHTTSSTPLSLVFSSITEPCSSYRYQKPLPQSPSKRERSPQSPQRELSDRLRRHREGISEVLPPDQRYRNNDPKRDSLETISILRSIELQERTVTLLEKGNAQSERTNRLLEEILYELRQRQKS